MTDQPNNPPKSRDTEWMRWDKAKDSLEFYIKDTEALLKELDEIRKSPMSEDQLDRLKKQVKNETMRTLNAAMPSILGMIHEGRPTEEENRHKAPSKELIAEFEQELIKRKVNCPPNLLDTVKRLKDRCEDICYRILEKKDIRQELLTELEVIKNVPVPVPEKYEAVMEQLRVINADICAFEGQHKKQKLEIENISKEVIEKCINPMLQEEKMKFEKARGALEKMQEDITRKVNNPDFYLQQILEARRAVINKTKSPWYSGADESFFA